MKKLLSVLLALTLVFAFASTAMAATPNTATEKVVIDLSSSDPYAVTIFAGDSVEVFYKDGATEQKATKIEGLPEKATLIDGNKVVFDKTVSANTYTLTAKYGTSADNVKNITVEVKTAPTYAINFSDLKELKDVEFTVKRGDIVVIQNGNARVALSGVANGEDYNVTDKCIVIDSDAAVGKVFGKNVTIDGKIYGIILNIEASSAKDVTSVSVVAKKGTTELGTVVANKENGFTWVLPVGTDAFASLNFVKTETARCEIISGLLFNGASGKLVYKVIAEDGTSVQNEVAYRLAGTEVGINGVKVAGKTATLREGSDSVFDVKLTSAELDAFYADKAGKLVVDQKDANAVVKHVKLKEEADKTYIEFFVVAEADKNLSESYTYFDTYKVYYTIDKSNDATVKKVETTINNGTADKTYTAEKSGSTFTLTVPTEPVSTKYNVVITPNNSYVSSVKVAGKAVLPVEGVYTTALTLAADKTSQDFAVEIVAEDGSSNAVYTLKLQRGTPVAVVPTLAITGASGTTYTTDDTTPAIKYTVTNGTVTAVKVDNATTKVDSITADTINLKGLTLGNSYKMVVTVTATDNSTKTFEYTVKCANLATLFDDLFISKKSSGSTEYAFKDKFAPGVFEYVVDEDFEVEELSDMIDLYLQMDLASGYTSSSKRAKIDVTLNGEDCSSLTSGTDGYYYVKLDSADMEMGENDIEISYKNGDDEYDYTITFTIKGDVDDSVEIEDFDIRKGSGTSGTSNAKLYDGSSDGFDKDVTDYEISLDKEYAGKTVYLHIDLADSDAEVAKATNATKAKTDIYSVEVPKTGAVKVELKIENDDTDEEVTYTFSISADGSTDKAQLKKAYFAKSESTSSSKQYYITPAFKAGQYDYVVVVDDGEEYTDVNFYVELANKNDKIEIDVEGGDDYTEDKEWYTFEMEEGDEVEVTVKVTDSKSSKVNNTYNFVVIKGDNSNKDDVDMTGIKLNTKSSGSSSTAIALNKTFAEKTKEYTATVASTVDKIYVSPSFKKAELVVVNGKEVKTGKYAEVDGLVDGKNVIEVVAFSENMEEKLEYTITVTKGGVEDLSYLAVVSGSQTLSLSPAFNKDVHNYAAIADNSQSGVYFSAFAGEDAKITVSQSVNSTVLATKTISSTSYSTSGTFTLYTGINVFTVNISNDSDAETYYVSVYKQPTALNITKSEQKVSVDGGTAKTLYAYNINGNNFIKIRDLAVLLKGSDKQFGISYNTATTTINLTSGSSYTAQTGDNTALPAYKSGAVVSTQPFYLDGTKIVPMAYNIGGNNYLMIRDLAVFLDFAVTYNSTYNRIDIDTDASYNPTK